MEDNGAEMPYHNNTMNSIVPGVKYQLNVLNIVNDVLTKRHSAR